MADGIIDPSMLGGQTEVGLRAAGKDDDRLARGIQRLPANPSLDDLLELRRQVTVDNSGSNGGVPNVMYSTLGI